MLDILTNNDKDHLHRITLALEAWDRMGIPMIQYANATTHDEFADLDRIYLRKQWSEVLPQDVSPWYANITPMEPVGCAYYLATFIKCAIIAMLFPDADLRGGADDFVEVITLACDKLDSLDSFHDLLSSAQVKAIHEFLEFCCPYFPSVRHTLERWRVRSGPDNSKGQIGHEHASESTTFKGGSVKETT